MEQRENNRKMKEETKRNIQNARADWMMNNYIGRRMYETEFTKHAEVMNAKWEE